MHSVEIAPNVFWVGAVDWNVRDFHGYSTNRGTTYNAYLVLDEKVALIDTVKRPFAESFLAKIAEHVDPARIDYVISNHTEPDHSGSLEKVLAAAPHAKYLASEKGKAGLEQYYRKDFNWEVVKTGDQIELGKYTLDFVNTPMLHWPDSMFTYIPQIKLLFSMDAFGQHLASSLRFDTQVEHDVVMAEAKTYYANIIMHLGNVVNRTLKALDGIEVETVCPSHGVVWTKMIPEIVAKYQDWAVCKPANKVLVIYDSMWQSTEIMADTFTDTLARQGILAKRFRLGVNDLTMLATEILDAAAVLVGSPTLNNGMMPSVAAFLTYIKGLRPKNKLADAFGSYGWSGGAVAQAAQMLEDTGFEMFAEEHVECIYRPDESTLQKCRETAELLAQRVKSITGTQGE